MGGILTIRPDCLPPGRHWSRDGRIDPAAEDQERRLREEARLREEFDADAFLAEMAHPWLCHQRLFEQMDVVLERIGREESGCDAQEAREEARDAARRMKRILRGISIETLELWLGGERPRDHLREDPEVARVVENTCDILGEPVPVKVWLVSALRKKIALFREHDLADTLAV